MCELIKPEWIWIKREPTCESKPEEQHCLIFPCLKIKWELCFHQLSAFQYPHNNTLKCLKKIINNINASCCKNILLQINNASLNNIQEMCDDSPYKEFCRVEITKQSCAICNWNLGCLNQYLQYLIIFLSIFHNLELWEEENNETYKSKWINIYKQKCDVYCNTIQFKIFANKVFIKYKSSDLYVSSNIYYIFGEKRLYDLFHNCSNRKRVITLCKLSAKVAQEWIKHDGKMKLAKNKVLYIPPHIKKQIHIKKKVATHRGILNLLELYSIENTEIYTLEQINTLFNLRNVNFEIMFDFMFFFEKMMYNTKLNYDEK